MFNQIPLPPVVVEEEEERARGRGESDWEEKMDREPEREDTCINGRAS